MKLTNYIRDSFVRAVINDIPEIAWPTASQVQAMAEKKMHPKLKAVYKDDSLRKCLEKSYYTGNHTLNYTDRGYVYFGNMSEKELLVDKYEQVAKVSEAKSKVKALAYSCTTLKQLKDAAPDLIKYMPTEGGKVTVGLPAIVGLNDALKDAGFPKETSVG